MTGPPGRPLRAGASVIDVTGGMFGVIGILAALEQRRRTGVGQAVDCSLFETTAFLVGQHMAQKAVTGEAARPMPVRVSAWAIYDVFDVAEGEQVFLGVVSDAQWESFTAAFDLADWAADPELKLNNARVAQRDRLLPRLRQPVRAHAQGRPPGAAGGRRPALRADHAAGGPRRGSAPAGFRRAGGGDASGPGPDRAPGPAAAHGRPSLRRGARRARGGGGLPAGAGAGAGPERRRGGGAVRPWRRWRDGARHPVREDLVGASHRRPVGRRRPGAGRPRAAARAHRGHRAGEPARRRAGRRRARPGLLHHGPCGRYPARARRPNDHAHGHRLHHRHAGGGAGAPASRCSTSATPARASCM